MDLNEGLNVSVVDLTTYLIKDELPSAVVSNLESLIDRIPGVKNFTDFKVFVMIEFYSKAEARAAKKAGFRFKSNGQDAMLHFRTLTSVSLYIQDKFIPNVGIGF